MKNLFNLTSTPAPNHQKNHLSKKNQFLWIIASLLFLSFNMDAQVISNNMTKLGHWDSGLAYNDCWGYVADGREYAIIGSRDFVHFLDITCPSQPTLIQEVAPGANTGWRDFKVYDHYVFGCAQNGAEGLITFDVSTLPDSVNFLGNITTDFTTAHNIYIDEANARLYVVGSNTQNSGMIVYDISIPTNPVVIGNSSLPGGYLHDVHVVDNIAYASSLSSGFWVYDYTDAANPIVLGSMTSYEGSVFNHSAWLNDAKTHVVFCDERHGEPVKIVDVTDFEDIFLESTGTFSSTLLSPTYTNSIAHNPFILGDLAIVAYYHEGVQIFDISDPTNVTPYAYYDTYENTSYSGYNGVWGVYPYFPSGVIIASDRSNGLFVLEIGCAETKNVTDLNAKGAYVAWSEVSTTGPVVIQDDATFSGQKCVSLNVEFEVAVGASFEANLNGCN